MTLRERLALPTPPRPTEPTRVPERTIREPEWIRRQRERLEERGRVAETDLTNAG